MAGSSTSYTVTKKPYLYGSLLTEIILDWVSDDSTGSVIGKTTEKFTGQILQLITDPGSSAPTDNYDITVTDYRGADVLVLGGADRDTAITEIKTSAGLGVPFGYVVNSTLTFSIGNAGNSKNGRIYLHILE